MWRDLNPFYVVIADLGVDDAGLGSVESERSNASVYHANFEKVEVRLYLDKFWQEIQQVF